MQKKIADQLICHYLYDIYDIGEESLVTAMVSDVSGDHFCQDEFKDIEKIISGAKVKSIIPLWGGFEILLTKEGRVFRLSSFPKRVDLDELTDEKGE